MNRGPFIILSGTWLLPLVIVSPGCRSHLPASPPAARQVVPGQFVEPYIDDDLRARCSPPRAWEPKPLEHLPRSVQRVWVSPTGHTAYGVIHIRLPWPFGPDVVLWRFLAGMRETEGEGRLLTRERNGDEVNFVAETPKYRLTARLHTAGWNAWVIYASVLRDQPVDGAEFPLAESARDVTVPGAVTESR
jgi:hypothetical protein